MTGIRGCGNSIGSTTIVTIGIIEAGLLLDWVPKALLGGASYMSERLEGKESKEQTKS